MKTLQRLSLGALSAGLILAMSGCLMEEDANRTRPSPQLAIDRGCPGTDPSTAGCDSDSECAAGQSCQVVAGACQPSACSCDVSTGLWQCTADCGEARACAPIDPSPPTACEGPDPSIDGCDSAADCGVGEVCAPSGIRACRPSSCGCDEDTGFWICTDDCGVYNSCQAAPVSACDEPDPSVNGCDSDRDCDADESCVIDESQVCRPSSCFCDESTGSWGCTRDCNTYNVCAPKPACPGEDPSVNGCDSNRDCAAGEACVVDEGAGCRPSSCFCDADTGAWACTKDCGTYNVCAPAPPQCPGEDPSTLGCETNADCANRTDTCQVVPNVCRPSSCGCGEDGLWICTADCQVQRACGPRSR